MLPNLCFFYMYKNTYKIITNTRHIEELKKTFSNIGYVKVSDIITFYRQFDKDMKRATVD